MNKHKFNNLPKKRVGVSALFFNSKKELLIVKPVHKDGWQLPGGSIEDNESPRNACIREIKEEVGLNIKINKFLCVDLIRGHFLINNRK